VQTKLSVALIITYWNEALLGTTVISLRYCFENNVVLDYKSTSYPWKVVYKIRRK